MVMIDEIIDEKIRFWNRLLEGYSSMKQFLKEVNYLGTKILKCRKFVDKNYDQNKKILRPG